MSIATQVADAFLKKDYINGTPAELIAEIMQDEKIEHYEGKLEAYNTITFDDASRLLLTYSNVLILAKISR